MNNKNTSSVDKEIKTSKLFYQNMFIFITFISIFSKMTR
uniref:CPBP family intramembrane metalloprotease n=1 Tax=Strongyloides papillosus TaxID=174720 RepID=A0A0N5BE74_STREA